MKGRLVQGIAGMVAVLGVFASAGSVSADPPRHDYYMALGDSVAAGQGATVPHRFGYTGLFKHFYRVNHRGTERFAELAVPGETSTSFVDAQLGRALETIDDPRTEVQVVTLTLGANDFLPLLRAEPCASSPSGVECRSQVAVALSDFAVNYHKALSELTQALNNDPGAGRVLVTTYYNPFDGTGVAVEGPVDAALLGADLVVNCQNNAPDPNVGLNDIITCMGGRFGAEVADIYPLFDGKAQALTHIAENDIHPNDDGHQAIADEVIEVFQGGP